MTNTKEITVNQYYNKNAVENIFVTNLSMYNDGCLFGVWVSLPQDNETLSSIVNYINRNGNDELFITDFEGTFHVDEFDDIDELNERAQELEDMDECELKAVRAYLSQVSDDIDDAIEHAQDVTILPDDGYNVNYNIGYYFAIECGCLDIPDNIVDYFDFEAYGRDICFDYSVATDNENIYLFSH